MCGAQTPTTALISGTSSQPLIVAFTAGSTTFMQAWCLASPILKILNTGDCVQSEHLIHCPLLNMIFITTGASTARLCAARPTSLFSWYVTHNTSTVFGKPQILCDYILYQKYVCFDICFSQFGELCPLFLIFMAVKKPIVVLIWHVSAKKTLKILERDELN